MFYVSRIYSRIFLSNTIQSALVTRSLNTARTVSHLARDGDDISDANYRGINSAVLSLSVRGVEFPRAEQRTANARQRRYYAHSREPHAERKQFGNFVRKTHFPQPSTAKEKTRAMSWWWNKRGGREADSRLIRRQICSLHSRGTLEIVNFYGCTYPFAFSPAHPLGCAKWPTAARRGVANRTCPLLRPSISLCRSLAALTRIYSGELITRC